MCMCGKPRDVNNSENCGKTVVKNRKSNLSKALENLKVENRLIN